MTEAAAVPPRPWWRQLIGFNLLTGIILGVAGWYIGWFGAHKIVGPSIGYFSATDYNELSVYLVGWRGYFRFCQTPSVLRALDEWTRRRLRAIAWKQWKRGRTRFAELRRRGVGRDLAAKTAGSPHGPWRLANSPALAIALPNAFFGSLGLAPVAAPHTT